MKFKKMLCSMPCKIAFLIYIFMVMSSSLIIKIGFAELLSCDQINNTFNDKVVLDDVKGFLPIDSQILHDVVSALDMKIGALEKYLSEAVIFVPCKNRYATGASDFGKDRSGDLNSFNVMVEIWGEAYPEKIFVYYMVIPLRHYEHFMKSKQDLTGYHEVSYPRGKGDSDLAALFKEAPEAKALVTIALGVKYLARAESVGDDGTATRDFDSAREFFCRAAGILEQIKTKSGQSGPDQTDRKKLCEYSKNSAKETALKALSNQHYKGAMRALDNDKQRLENCASYRGESK
jgi:hypothetical protein